MELNKSLNYLQTGNDTNNSARRNREQFEQFLSSASMLHSTLAAQLDSAQKKIRELELANDILTSEREELTERLKEKEQSNDYYRCQYFQLVDEISRIPAWIKSLYGV